jgi:hypothetical protein
MWGDMSKCGENSTYVQYMCTLASLRIDKLKKLVKLLKQVQRIKLVIEVEEFAWV